MKSILNTWSNLPSRAKDIGMTVAIIVVLLFVFKTTAFAYNFFNRFKTHQFVQTFLEENSPIAEMSTRRIKWRISTTDDGIGKTKASETVYVVKTGYDFSSLKPEDVTVDSDKKCVTITLPPVEVLAVDHTLSRQNTIDKASFVRRMLPYETGVPLTDLKEFCNLVLDMEDNDLLDAQNSREGLTKFIGTFLKGQFGYDCVFLVNEKDKDLDYLGTDSEEAYRARVEAIFTDYLKKKGTIPPDFKKILKETKGKRQNAS